MDTPEPYDIQPEAVVRSSKKDKDKPVRSRYRACLLCSFVQDSKAWVSEGCPNCEDILEARGHQNRVKEVSSLQFDGVIAMLKPSESWVSRWQRTTNFVPGLYAARVIGRLPPFVLDTLESKGIPHVPRDNVAGE